MNVDEVLLAHYHLGKFILDVHLDNSVFEERSIETVGCYKEVLNHLLKDSGHDVYSADLDSADPSSELELIVSWLFELLDQDNGITSLDVSAKVQLDVMDKLSKEVEDHQDTASFEHYVTCYNQAMECYNLSEFKIERKEQVAPIRAAIKKVRGE